MKIRIKFQKQGTVRFIGHLDVMRYFQKVMRRAEVDIRYSEGFSPHQIMSFASPLSVGLISHAEYVDIDVNSSGNSTGMVRRLNEVSAEGLEVLSYRELPETAKNAMSLVAAADYTFWFKEGFAPEDGSSVEEFFGKFLTFCKSETIPFVKQTKKGERTVDLRPLICEARIAERKEYVPAMVADWYPDLENETVEEEKQAEGICVFHTPQAAHTPVRPRRPRPHTAPRARPEWQTGGRSAPGSHRMPAIPAPAFRLPHCPIRGAGRHRLCKCINVH